MTKKQRLDAIINLINNEEISTQEELTAKLIALGENVSQSTVSRDISELNLVKAEGVNRKFKYVQAGIKDENTSPQMISLLKHVMQSVTSANNLIVVKTLGGNAGSAGMAIDSMNFNEILGSVAGDDTLLIITKTNHDAEVILKILRSI